MDYQTFTTTVARRAAVPQDEAERIERATLRTLADRISGGEAQDLASLTPGEFDDVASQLPSDYRALVGPVS